MRRRLLDQQRHIVFYVTVVARKLRDVPIEMIHKAEESTQAEDDIADRAGHVSTILGGQ